MEKSYVSRNFRRSISYHDLVSRPEFNTKLQLENSVQSAFRFISGNRSFSSKIVIDNSKKKPIYSIPDPAPYLSLKLLNKNLISIFSIRPAHRETIVKNLIHFLKENSSYTIHRLDIKSFYESVDRRDLFSRLSSTGCISRSSLSLIKSLFSELDAMSVFGLPRGLAISSTLSEILLRDFDEKISKRRDVFFYARFVDDIVLITSPNANKSNLLECVKNLLPKGLLLHEHGDKKTSMVVNKASKTNHSRPRLKKKSFSYLGYEYFPTLEQKDQVDCTFSKSNRNVEIDLSKDKFEKIKSRLIVSFTNFMATAASGNRDFDLLKKRLSFLTGNYCLEVHKGQYRYFKMSGYHFNYPELNQEKRTNELDFFLKYLLFNNSAKLPRRISSWLNISERRELAKYSFIAGYQKKAFYTFTYMDFVSISKVWK